jgi:hypothetical protein
VRRKNRVLEGNRATGILQMRRAIRDFDALGMPMDAGFASLDLLEALVEAKDSAREAEALARELADLFLKAGANVSATKALDFLRQAVENGSADAKLIEDVRRYLRRSTVYPEEPFVPRSREGRPN